MIEIRPGRLEERPAFRRMWRHYLEGQQEHGGDILPTARTLAFFDALYALYVQGDLAGTAMLALDEGRPVGVVLWGVIPNRMFDVRWKRPAQGWGTYVEPGYRGQGVSDKMREAAKKELREQGVDAVFGTVLRSNQVGLDSGLSAGFRITQHIGVLEL